MRIYWNSSHAIMNSGTNWYRFRYCVYSHKSACFFPTKRNSTYDHFLSHIMQVQISTRSTRTVIRIDSSSCPNLTVNSTRSNLTESQFHTREGIILHKPFSFAVNEIATFSRTVSEIKTSTRYNPVRWNLKNSIFFKRIFTIANIANPSSGDA